MIAPNLLLKRAIRATKAARLCRAHFRQLGPHKPMMADSEFDRIYHVHSRKTAGTSLAMAFLELSGTSDSKALWKDLAYFPFNVGCNGWRFSAWTNKALRYPQFDFGFSHVPLYRLDLPARTFRFTVLRDPAERARSLYDMLVGFIEAGSTRPDHLPQMDWARDGFANFILRAPRKEIMGQLSMFSTRLNPAEGLERLSRIEMAIPIAHLDDGLKAIGSRFGVSLDPRRDMAAPRKYQPTESEWAQLREVLEPEYEFYNAAIALDIARPENWRPARA